MFGIGKKFRALRRRFGMAQKEAGVDMGPGWYVIYYRKGPGWKAAKGFEGPFATKTEANIAKGGLVSAYKVKVVKLASDPWILNY